MAADYATLADLKKHWSGLPADKEDDAVQKLHEASLDVRVQYPDVDRRLASGVLEPDVPRLVVCRMVKRALDVGDAEDMMHTPDGVESTQVSVGQFSRSFKFSNPDGNLFLSGEDRKLLGSRRNKSKAWTIHPA